MKILYLGSADGLARLKKTLDENEFRGIPGEEYSPGSGFMKNNERHDIYSCNLLVIDGSVSLSDQILIREVIKNRFDSTPVYLFEPPGRNNNICVLEDQRCVTNSRTGTLLRHCCLPVSMHKDGQRPPNFESINEVFVFEYHAPLCANAESG